MDRLHQAEQACAVRGQTLTPIRRSVLALVLGAPGPVGAYELLDQLKVERANAAPVTVYRALGFLQENGLVHKIERLNAFVACTDLHADANHTHSVQFLICRRCGSVAEMEDAEITAAVLQAAVRTRFRPDHATVEVEGMCEVCIAG